MVMRKRNIETQLLLRLRRIGLLCKKPVYKPVIKVSKTVYPEGVHSFNDVFENVHKELNK
jgi:hypothetical protein